MKTALGRLVAEARKIPGCLGRMVCELGTNGPLVQWNADGREFELLGGDKGSCWRYIIVTNQTERILVQVDLHGDGDIRVQAFEPVSIQVSEADGILCVTRLQVTR